MPQPMGGASDYTDATANQLVQKQEEYDAKRAQGTTNPRRNIMPIARVTFEIDATKCRDALIEGGESKAKQLGLFALMAMIPPHNVFGELDALAEYGIKIVEGPDAV
jgi:hypothetical protein